MVALLTECSHKCRRLAVCSKGICCIQLPPTLHEARPDLKVPDTQCYKKATGRPIHPNRHILPPQSTTILHYIALYCVALQCTLALHCTALHPTELLHIHFKPTPNHSKPLHSHTKMRASHALHPLLHMPVWSKAAKARPHFGLYAQSPLTTTPASCNGGAQVSTCMLTKQRA